MPAFLGCFLACSISCLRSLIFVLRSACSFSLALCLGRSDHIVLRHASFSSGVCAFLYSASASRYWGVRLAAMAGRSQESPRRGPKGPRVVLRSLGVEHRVDADPKAW